MSGKQEETEAISTPARPGDELDGSADPAAVDPTGSGRSDSRDGDAAGGDGGDQAAAGGHCLAGDPFGVKDHRREPGVENSAMPGTLAAPSATAASGKTSLAEESAKPAIPELLPILPVRDTVVFPGTIVPLTIGREKSKKLIGDVITGSKVLGIVAQRSAETEDPSLDDLYRVGTVVTVLKLLNLAEGNQSIIVHGLTRFGIEEFVQTEPYLVARAHPRADVFTGTTELEALMATAKAQAEKVISLTPGVPEEAITVLSNIDNPSSLADFLAANLALELVRRQELLETFDVALRLRKINESLAHQLEVLELSRQIHEQVRSRIDKNQREYYLHEQLDAIRKELGESDSREAEAKELRESIAKARMPEAVQKEAERELERMLRIPQASPEYSGIVDYLHWLCELPWSVATEDHLDIRAASKVLEADHYGLDKIKKRILEFLAVRKLNPAGRVPILCFAGPPGVGKTSLGQSIARAIGRKFIRMSVGGVRDEADIRGHRRTYIGALPGRIIQEIRKAGSNNPVFMIDEIDKIGADFRGDPSSALLEVLDPEQNSTFQDHYLGVPFDLSRVMFICTANYMDAVPPPLRDRMEVIDLPGYTRLEKLQIARRYLAPRQLRECGLEKRRLRFADEAIEAIIESYTAEAGVRNLEREIGAVCRGIAAQVAAGKRHPSIIRKRHLAEYLGPIKHEPELALRTSTPGVVTGLAWTPVGGDILFIEATSMPGKGQLQMTGHLGDVMRESAQAALSVVRSQARKYRLDGKSWAALDLHIHVPAGAIPKDGPSAGLAMLTAIVSLLRKQPCRSDTAMTGEITLRGLVLPIGGLKEKTLAAHRAGIRRIIIPYRNRKDLADIPREVARQITFVPVRTVEEALRAALADKPAAGGRKRRPSPAATPNGGSVRRPRVGGSSRPKSSVRQSRRAAAASRAARRN